MTIPERNAIYLVMYPFRYRFFNDVKNPFNIWNSITSVDQCNELLLRWARLEFARTEILADPATDTYVSLAYYSYGINLRSLDVID